MQKVAASFAAVASAVGVDQEGPAFKQMNNLERAAADSDYPGNVAKRSETTFTKSFGNDPSTLKGAKSHFNVESRALQRLYEARDACMDGQNHFPMLINADEKALRLVVSHQGLTLSSAKHWKDSANVTRGNEECCIDENSGMFEHEHMDVQVDCIVNVMQKAQVRHLDLLCDPMALRNVAINCDGTLSLIDFDIATIDNQPTHLMERCCYDLNRPYSDGNDCGGQKYWQKLRRFLKERAVPFAKNRHGCQAQQKRLEKFNAKKHKNVQPKTPGKPYYNNTAEKAHHHVHAQHNDEAVHHKHMKKLQMEDESAPESDLIQASPKKLRHAAQQRHKSLPKAVPTLPKAQAVVQAPPQQNFRSSAVPEMFFRDD